MKIVINKTGKVEDVSLKLAQRLINQGKAHKDIPVIIPLDKVQKKELLKNLIVPKKEIIDIPDEVFEAPKPKKSRKKKSKWK